MVATPRTLAWDPRLLETGSEELEGLVMAGPTNSLAPALRKSLAQAHLNGLRVYPAEAFAEAVFRKVLLREVDEEWVLDRELALAQSAGAPAPQPTGQNSQPDPQNAEAEAKAKRRAQATAEMKAKGQQAPQREEEEEEARRRR